MSRLAKRMALRQEGLQEVTGGGDAHGCGKGLDGRREEVSAVQGKEVAGVAAQGCGQDVSILFRNDAGAELQATGAGRRDH